MFTLHYTINGVGQLDSVYPDRDDPLRKVNQLWKQRDEMARELRIPAAQCQVRFEIASDTGTLDEHDDILREIRQRPELREPPQRQ
jgi:hypothetical protein